MCVFVLHRGQPFTKPNSSTGKTHTWSRWSGSSQLPHSVPGNAWSGSSSTDFAGANCLGGTLDRSSRNLVRVSAPCSISLPALLSYSLRRGGVESLRVLDGCGEGCRELRSRSLNKLLTFFAASSWTSFIKASTSILPLTFGADPGSGLCPSVCRERVR